MNSDKCKATLVAHFQTNGTPTSAKEWKRRSKHQNSAGETVRRFEHPTMGTIDVVERGGIGVIEEARTAEQTPDSDLPRWSSSDIEGAGALIKKLQKLADNHADNGVHEVMASAEYARHQHALPAVIGFYFPDAYDNFEATEGGPDQKSGGLSVSFADLVHDVPDIELDTSSLIAHLFPVWLQNRADETCWDIDPDCTLTVLEVAQSLRSIGFSYAVSECFFSGFLVEPLERAPCIQGADRARVVTIREVKMALEQDDAPVFVNWLAQGAFKSADRIQAMARKACVERKPKVYAALLPCVVGVEDLFFDWAVVDAALDQPAGLTDFIQPLLDHPKFLSSVAWGQLLMLASPKNLNLTDPENGPREQMLAFLEQYLHARSGAKAVDAAWIGALARDPEPSVCKAFSQYFHDCPEVALNGLLAAGHFNGAAGVLSWLRPDPKQLMIKGQPAHLVLAPQSVALESRVRKEQGSRMQMFIQTPDGQYHRHPSHMELDGLKMKKLMAFLSQDAATPGPNGRKPRP